MKQVVIAESDAGAYVVGPVHTDASLKDIREAVEERGDTVRATARLLSWAEYRTGGAS